MQTLTQARGELSTVRVGVGLLIVLLAALFLREIVRRKIDRPGAVSDTHSPAESEDAADHRATIPQDFLFLSLIVFLSVIPYLHVLGFYSDDWAYLGNFGRAEQPSVGELFRAIHSPHMAMRPLQLLSFTWLYMLFGLSPFGYHVANALVLLAMACLIYLCLRALGLSRALTLAVPLVFILAPHYSTNRFWYSAFPINFSLILYLLSLHSDLRSLTAKTITRFRAWLVLSAASLIASSLTYELTMPLFLFNPVLVWWKGGQLDQAGGRLVSRPKLWARGALTLLVLIPVVAYKALTTVRLEARGSLSAQLLAISKGAFALEPLRYDYGLNYWKAVEVSYGELVIGLPRAVWVLLRDHGDRAATLAAAAISILVSLYLFRLLWPSAAATTWAGSSALRLIDWGVVTFLLGYGIFLTNDNILITATGLGNRVNIVSTVGVALSVVGAILLVCGGIRDVTRRALTVSVLVGLICGGYAFVNSTTGLLWAAAYRQETEVLSGIRKHLPDLPPGSKVMLDGVCPYMGPAVVFESSWDLAGALWLQYGHQRIQADVLIPSVRIEQDGLRTALYGQEHLYTYDGLVVYHHRAGQVFWFRNADEAGHYAETVRPAHAPDCPPGREGLGTPIF